MACNARHTSWRCARIALTMRVPDVGMARDYLTLCLLRTSTVGNKILELQKHLALEQLPADTCQTRMQTLCNLLAGKPAAVLCSIRHSYALCTDPMKWPRAASHDLWHLNSQGHRWQCLTWLGLALTGEVCNSHRFRVFLHDLHFWSTSI